MSPKLEDEVRGWKENESQQSTGRARQGTLTVDEEKYEGDTSRELEYVVVLKRRAELVSPGLRRDTAKNQRTV
jgi:hypothetical protein